MTILAHIDLRGTLGAARDQGQRPTCLAFALSDVNGHANSEPAPLSPEFLYRKAASKVAGWKPGDGLQLAAAIDAVAAPGQPFEILCPYIEDEPAVPLTFNALYSPMFSGQYLSRAPNWDDIALALNGGTSVGLVIKLTPEFYLVDAATAQVPFTPGVINGSHAVVVVGHGIDSTTSEPHLLIRNSWGVDWGDGGHAWISERYVAAHGLVAFGV